MEFTNSLDNVHNEYFTQGYVEGYRRAKSINGDKKEISKVNMPSVVDRSIVNMSTVNTNMSTNNTKTIEPMHLYSSPYIIITYPTAVVMLLALFIIFVMIAMHIDKKPVTYVSNYDQDCLLKMTSSYSGVGCV